MGRRDVYYQNLMAAKNTTTFSDVPISPLTGQMDLRSPSGTVPIGDFRVVLNASMNELRKRCRRSGYRKFGFNSPQGFNNQDLHDQLLEQDGCGGSSGGGGGGGGGGCNAPTVTIDPPSGSFVLAGTLVVLSSPVEGAFIYYTTDGSTPTVNSTLYTGPFELPLGETVIKAIGVSGACISSVFTFTYRYSDEILEFMEFHFLCNSDDKAGVFFEFEPNGAANDYIWELDFATANPMDVKRLEIYETDPDGLWTTGQAWATDNPVYPPELGGPFAIYPLVMFSGETQLNTEYETTVVPGVTPGTYHWLLYGQPFVANVGYFKLRWVVVIDGEESSIYVIIPNECDCGYYDDQCCYYGYGDYEYYDGCYDPPPTSDNIVNIDIRMSGDTEKEGAAAVGVDGDYWNTFNFVFNDFSEVFPLLWANGTESPLRIVETNEQGPISIFDAAGTTSHSDEMMKNYGKTPADFWRKSLAIQRFPRGTYDIYVYGHGNNDGEILKCWITTPLQTTEVKSTGPNWNGPFQENENYVLFENISFIPIEETEMRIDFPYDEAAYISGIQIVKVV